MLCFYVRRLYESKSRSASPEDRGRDRGHQARDSKAVAEGVKDGLSNRHSVDLNKGSKNDLTSLPGITDHKADRIIAERPYANAHQLVTRHVLTEDEYAQVQDRVVVNR